MNYLTRLTLLACVLTIAACSSATEQSNAVAPAVPPAELLVDVEWVQEHLTDPDILIVDMRAPNLFELGHVPGAVNLPVDRISETVNGIPMEFESDKVAASLGAIGLERSDTVVVYDNLGMMDAARLFWTLEYVGHPDVRVVDGGWNAWQEAGAVTATGLPDVADTDYALQIQESRRIGADSLLDRLDDPGLVVVDARALEEYTGEVKLAERGGHIPGAVHFVWSAALTGGDTAPAFQPDWRKELEDPDVELFRPREELGELLARAGITSDKSVVTYCQTLWRGAHVYFLLRYMGYTDVAGYDGSWAEWGNRADLPVVAGPNPR